MPAPLSTDLDDPDAYPWFLWDDPMTVRELRQLLARGDEVERDRMLGKILREARDTDVWHFTTPDEVRRRWEGLSPYLGRRREFWRWILAAWERSA